MLSDSPLLPRRELLRVGALSLFGAVARGSAWGGDAAGGVVDTTTSPQRPNTRPRKCIFILLQGGPSHLDLWDLKPEAPAEIRGPFKPIDTNVSGMQIGELLPQTAQVANHLALVRSVFPLAIGIRLVGVTISNLAAADEAGPDAALPLFAD